MIKLLNISHLFLAISIVLSLLAIDGFVAQRQYSSMSIELTELGHDALSLRDEAIAFNSGYAITPYLFTKEIVESEKALDLFLNDIHSLSFGLFLGKADDIHAVIEQYSNQHVNLMQSIDNLVALIIARNDALNAINSLSDTDQLLNTSFAQAESATQHHLQIYHKVNMEVSGLLDDLLLGETAEFVEEAENKIKNLALITLQASFTYFILALVSFIAYILFSSWLRVNKLKQLNNELTEASENADKASEAKTLFLATMSHELRTPMNGVLGMAELIVDETNEDLTRKHAKIIGESGKHLMTILNDILDFSKVEQGEMAFEKVSFNMATLLDPVANSLRPVAYDKNITLEIDSNVPSGLYFINDSSRLRQVIFNLVGNAIKFTDKGHVRVTSDFDPDAKWLYFFIEDTGVGIPQDRLAHIFEPFRQAETSTSRRFGGTGLGLSIVKKIILQMKGKVEVSSKEGQGSLFTVSLPVDVDENPKSRAVTPIDFDLTKPIEHLPLNVLIADDNAVNAMLAKRLCEQLGHKADTVENGKLAVIALKQKHYHLVLMDKHMPIMDGVESIKHIRQKLNLPTVIFACTADVFREAHDELLDIGANHVLTKPMQKSSLEEAITLFIEAFAEAEKLVNNIEDAPESTNVVALSKLPKRELKMTEEELSSSTALAVFAEEHDVVTDLLCLMIEEFEKASDDLIQGFTDLNVVKIFKTLHIVRGTALDLGLPNLARISKDNEKKAQNGIVPDSTTLQEILNLMSVNIHQAKRILESYGDSVHRKAE
ncbi:ATP-binding protein [Enterovibrio sp. ZSDZ35]|uniref:histidine kinase n=1 Tax=Enterovibrio qingdaonensis TaxID=2899818 RepID=A0ABT5QHT4_9GAMM|nr:ATP-binding protein [Enterovibrio sp. ZSDZ35]MDD1780551.1 ATP-binding protein [Enterovibrio sp. ZSDZ35]